MRRKEVALPLPGLNRRRTKCPSRRTTIVARGMRVLDETAWSTAAMATALPPSTATGTAATERTGSTLSWVSLRLLSGTQQLLVGGTLRCPGGSRGSSAPRPALDVNRSGLEARLLLTLSVRTTTSLSLYVWLFIRSTNCCFSPHEICKFRILYRILLRAIVMPSREESSNP